jgi:hypothetical protein
MRSLVTGAVLCIGGGAAAASFAGAAGCGGDSHAAVDAAAPPDAAAPDGAPDAWGADPCDPSLVRDLDPLADGYASSLAGSTEGSGRRHTGSCGGAAPQVVHSYTLPVAGDLVIDVDPRVTRWDALMFARTACADPESEVACNDDRLPGILRAPHAEARSLAAGARVYVFLDGYARSDLGDYKLDLRVRPLVGAGAQCDPEVDLVRCGEGLACRATPEDALGGRCMAAHAPVLGAAAARTLNADRLRVVLDGADQDMDADRIAIELLDAGGTPLAADFDGDGMSDGTRALVPSLLHPRHAVNGRTAGRQEQRGGDNEPDRVASHGGPPGGTNSIARQGGDC